MKVKASFFGPIRRPWKESSREIEVPTGTRLQDLLATFGYESEDLRRVAVVVNGKRRGLTFELNPGDDIRLVLMAGGG